LHILQLFLSQIVERSSVRSFSGADARCIKNGTEGAFQNGSLRSWEAQKLPKKYAEEKRAAARFEIYECVGS